MSNEAEDVVYMVNGRGGVALSLDGGFTVMIKTGRILPVAESIWEDSMDDLEDQLSEVQVEALQKYRDQPPPTPLEEIIGTLGRKTRDRNRKEHIQVRRRVYKGILSEDAVVVPSEED